MMRVHSSLGCSIVPSLPTFDVSRPGKFPEVRLFCFRRRRRNLKSYVHTKHVVLEQLPHLQPLFRLSLIYDGITRSYEGYSIVDLRLGSGVYSAKAFHLYTGEMCVYFSTLACTSGKLLFA